MMNKHSYKKTVNRDKASQVSAVLKQNGDARQLTLINNANMAKSLQHYSFLQNSLRKKDLDEVKEKICAEAIEARLGRNDDPSSPLSLKKH